MEKAQRRLMEEHDILTALDNQQFAIWLQPQVDAPAARSAAPKCCCVSGRRMAAGRYRRR
jgi:hypothetical protein